ncbi:hypothetical protein BKP35_10390 [Anaerobacillus arseniciselenatis]|uniref:Uncharacterized protein n=1 Tax=Anaerobacillus arseniciselenatis TaxID=85682 RepID=A0A1S2LK91_9BACI|nr:hypothetical protein [Anaerobacillus arseniciselenatis]OIJ12959.1 hypothetical protein BKP35_10390 [Anaerobacillus arseniciselenatis]
MNNNKFDNPDKYIERRNLVDADTGENLGNKLMVSDETQVNIHSKKLDDSRKEYFDRKHRKDLFDEIAEGFTFTYINKVSELHEDERFTDDEKARIMYLGTFVNYSDKGSMLVVANGEPINKKQLKELLEISNKKKFYSFYTKLLVAEIIEEVPTEAGIGFKWSEAYHFKGKVTKGNSVESERFIKTYDKQIQELYQAKKANGKPVNSSKQLYTVFMVLPFVHYETNVLCKFPNKPFSECEPLTIDELASSLGFNRSNDLKRKMLKVELKELPVFSFNTTSKNTHITVNPFVVWRQNKMPEASLMVTFFDTAKRIAGRKGMKIELKDLIKLPQ